MDRGVNKLEYLKQKI